MYDSFMTKCPKCGHELEYQSKTGACMLAIYGRKPKKGEMFVFEYPSADVAYGLMDKIVRCQFCNSRVKLEIDIPLEVKCTPIIVKQKKYDYEGNYNPKHPDSIKRMKEFKKYFKFKDANRKTQ